MLEQKLHRYSVPADAASQRLKDLLREALPGLSSRQAFLIVLNGLVRRENGDAISDAGQMIDAGTSLTIDLRHGVRGEGKPQRAGLDKRANVLHDDEHLVVVNKAPGVLVQPVTDEEQKGAPLVELLKHYWQSKGAPAINPIVIQRLDFETSGLLVLAKTDEVAVELQKQLLPPRAIKRHYLAIVSGKTQFDETTWRTHLGRGQSGIRQTVSSLQRDAKEAITNAKTKERFEGGALVELELETGRTHQIRIHLAEAGHPILGDKLYRRLSEWILRKSLEDGFVVPKGKTPLAEALATARAEGADVPPFPKDAKRVMLHAHRLSFWHPIFEKNMHFEAEPPEDFARLLTRLKKRRPSSSPE